MGPSGKCILAFHRTFRWLRSSAERRRHVQVQAMPLPDLARILDGSKVLRQSRAGEPFDTAVLCSGARSINSAT
jgi:hypothetical protein